MSDRPARKRWAARRASRAVEQVVDEVVARGGGVDATTAVDAEPTGWGEHVRNRLDGLLAHDDPPRERVVGEAEGRTIDGVEQHRARIGQDAEHRLDRVGPDAQIVHDVTGQAGRLERRQIERYVGRRQNLAPGLVGDRGTHGRQPGGRALVVCGDARPRLERLGTEHEADRHAAGGSATPPARPRRPLGSIAPAPAAVGARERRADELPHPCERQARRERLLRDDEPGVDARDRIGVGRAERDGQRVHAAVLHVEPAGVRRLVGILEPDRHDGVAAAASRGRNGTAIE